MPPLLILEAKSVKASQLQMDIFFLAKWLYAPVLALQACICWSSSPSWVIGEQHDNPTGLSLGTTVLGNGWEDNQMC